MPAAQALLQGVAKEVVQHEGAFGCIQRGGEKAAALDLVEVIGREGIATDSGGGGRRQLGQHRSAQQELVQRRGQFVEHFTGQEFEQVPVHQGAGALRGAGVALQCGQAQAQASRPAAGALEQLRRARAGAAGGG